MNEPLMTQTGESLLMNEEILDACRGSPVTVSRSHSFISSVSIDSRQVREMSLFVPLKGERVDGHAFLEDAVNRGAIMLFVDEDEWQRRASGLLPIIRKKDVTVIRVNNTLTALQTIAGYYVKQFPNLYKIGVTGSNGKTTTKEIIGAILSRETETIINEGNMNSEIGLPLSVFNIRPHHQYAVFEMGMNYAGEMDVLADIVKPDAALITNIGIAHIGILGTKDAIAFEKKKIFKHFDGKQKSFLYENELYRSYLSHDVKGKIMLYGTEHTKGFHGYEDLGLDGMIIHWEEFRILYPFFGFHNLLNALGSISVACELGIEPVHIKEGLETVKPLFGRSQIIRNNITIIQDCYNANPDSVKEVLHFLRSVPWKGRKIVVLGSMLELGEKEEETHSHVAMYSATMGFEMVFLFGKEFEPAYRKQMKERSTDPVFWTSDFERLLATVTSFVKQGDLVLLKGSRGVELERLVPGLRKM
jgi:UDP-N-acetylmuramoyl-tripeptide--D-alanyl-D-alanine ligase